MGEGRNHDLAAPSASERICHELMHTPKRFNGLGKVSSKRPFLTAVRVPLVQAKPDVVPLGPLKVVNQGPIEHASHIKTILDSSCNLRA